MQMLKTLFIITLSLLFCCTSCSQDEEYNDYDTNEYLFYTESKVFATNPLIEVLNIRSATKQNSLQSIAVDKKNNQYIIFNGTNNLFKFSFSGKFLGRFSKPYTGHDNDVFIRDTNIYINGSSALKSEEYSKILYKYNTSNNQIEQINTQAIVNKKIKRVIGGICYNKNNKAYIVAFDYRGTYNAENDNLAIYEMDLESNKIDLIFETKWKGWFIQGATCINNYLYIACNNIPLKGYIYDGITIKIFNMDMYTLIDSIRINGEFEPEGLDYNIENGVPYLYMGIAKDRSIAKIFKFKAPFH